MKRNEHRRRAFLVWCGVVIISPQRINLLENLLGVGFLSSTIVMVK